MNTRYPSKIISKNKINESTVEVLISKPSDFNYVPAQYIYLILPELRYPDKRGNRRAFSIANAPKDDHIRIIFRVSESGFKKTLLELTPDEEFFIEGPFGTFIPPNDGSDFAMIAGGTGVTPFISMIENMQDEKYKGNVNLVLQNFSQDRAIFERELKDLCNKAGVQFKSFYGEVLLSTIKNIYDKNPQVRWYMSGTTNLINQVYRILKDLDVSSDNMFFDEIYPTGANLDLEHKSNFKQAVEQSPNHIVITDINGRILFANLTAEKLTGYSFSEMVGNTPRLWGGLMGADFYKKLWHTIKIEKKEFSGEVRNRNKNGEEYTVMARINPIQNLKGELLGFIGTEEDISFLKNTINKLEEKNLELEKTLRIMVGRELEMIKLKNELKNIREKTSDSDNSSVL